MVESKKARAAKENIREGPSKVWAKMGEEKINFSRKSL
jgi:hypothetical protein